MTGGNLSWEEMIQTLSERYGLIEGYHDVEGNYHPLDKGVRRSLLIAQGISVASEIEAAQALERYREYMTRSPLDEASVIDSSGDSHRISIHLLPESPPPDSLDGTIIFESGETIRTRMTRVESTPDLRAGFVNHTYQLDASLLPGYYTLKIQWRKKEFETLLISTPRQCYLPPEMVSGKSKPGLSIQLYALKSKRNQGVGDFLDLQNLLEWGARQGLRVVGVNPLHALFPGNPALISPYYPSSRQYLNWLYIAPELVPEWELWPQRSGFENPGFGDRLIDYKEVIRRKKRIFFALFEIFKNQVSGSGSERDLAFKEFRRKEGGTLERQCLYDAMYDRFHEETGFPAGWPQWHLAYRDPASEASSRFRENHQDLILFYTYLQWVTRSQLDDTVHRASGLGISLYLDLAVGAAPDGAEVWSSREAYSLQASIGAPPDHFAPLGQDWGLAPLNPMQVRFYAFEPFIRLLRSNMLPGGILRLDHVMGLFRLYWVVAGGGAGGYVQYPWKSFFGILALESHRSRCMVIGEDLGTVPQEVREEMGARQIFSWKVVYFEKDGERFRDPASYPVNSVATLNTHDLPTLRGFLSGDDLDLRFEIGQLSKKQKEDLAVERERDIQAFHTILREKGLLINETLTDGAMEMAAHLFLSRASSRIVLASLHDVLDDPSQPNLPGTVREYPNWTLRYEKGVEEIVADVATANLVASFCKGDQL